MPLSSTKPSLVNDPNVFLLSSFAETFDQTSPIDIYDPPKHDHHSHHYSLKRLSRFKKNKASDELMSFASRMIQNLELNDSNAIWQDFAKMKQAGIKPTYVNT